MERNTVPFRVGTNVSDMTALVSAQGVVRVDQGCLVIEFRESTLDMNTMARREGPVREVRIPIEDVDSVEVGRRWPWGSTLQVRSRTMAPLANLPGATGNEIRVRVRRRDHDRARELCVAVALLLAGEDIRRLGGDTGESA